MDLELPRYAKAGSLSDKVRHERSLPVLAILSRR